MAWLLDPELLELLACPCPVHAPLQSEADGSVLRCTSCGRRFPLRDGIAVLLLSEALPEHGGAVED
jgi:uncharacterized protein